jgi:chromosome segregation ATPase
MFDLNNLLCMKVREMYIEVCNDKNNLQDTLKLQLDQEYEARLRQQVDRILANKLDEQRNLLADRHSQERITLIGDYKLKLDAQIAEINKTRELLAAAEKDLEISRKERINLESSIEKLNIELNENNGRLSNFETTLAAYRQNEEKFNKEKAQLTEELENTRNELSESNLRAKDQIDDLKTKFEEEKVNLGQQLVEINKEKLDLTEACAAKASQLDLITRDLATIQLQCDQYKSDILGLNTKLTDFLSTKEELADTKNRLHDIDIKFDSLVQEKAQLDEAYEAKLNEIEQISDLLKKTELELVQFKNENNELKEKLEMFADTQNVLLQAKAKLKELELKNNQMSTVEQELIAKNELLSRVESELETSRGDAKKLRQEIEEKMVLVDSLRKTLLDNEQKQTNTEQVKSRLEAQCKQFEFDLDKIKQVNEQWSKNYNELVEKFETTKQSWSSERAQILARKEDEIQKVIERLEKRFEEDYTRFVQTHKEGMHRALNEKSQEYTAEREKLIEMYQKKLNEIEKSEQQLARQCKELREKLAAVPPQPVLADAECQSESNELGLNISDTINIDNEYINSLLDKIKSLEELLGNADSHFELELDKLRLKFEEEYRLKLEFELGKEVEKRLSQIEMSKNSARRNGSCNTGPSNNSIRSNSNRLNDFDDLYQDEFASTHDHQAMSASSSATLLSNFMKLKEELVEKERDIDEYRMRIENMECTYKENLKKCQQKHENDYKKVEQDLKESYKQLLSKSSADIDQMQLLVKKLKKANVDSNKVIESLKLEMLNENQKHLNELTSLKMQSEREKENLKEDYEKSVKRIALLENELNESEEHLKKQCELVRAELKQEYGNELSKMNARMKEMMKSHSNAIEILKKQHQYSSRASVDLRSSSCQV